LVTALRILLYAATIKRGGRGAEGVWLASLYNSVADMSPRQMYLSMYHFRTIGSTELGGVVRIENWGQRKGNGAFSSPHM